jgi:transcription antitermination factor NusA-like protein
LRNFSVFLQTIAKKGDKEYVPLAFQGVKVKAAVVLVARKETIDSYGIAPYINRISRLVKEGYDSIYVTGWGEEFIKKIIEIKKEVEGELITVLRRYDYQVRETVKGILFVCQSNLSLVARQRELQEEVKQAMSEIIPEFKNWEIKIVSIARIRGVGCKVAVRPVSGGDVFNSLSICFGENNERFEQLKLRLPNEFLAIVPWSDDTKKFIINALTPLRERYVHSIEIDEENLVANIEVLTDEAYNKALGRNNCNVKLARDLTGWLINIKGIKRSEIMPTTEEEVNEIIRTHVPEIKNEEIEILRTARIEGIGTKVIVKWKNNITKKFLASQACCGRDHEHLKTIQQEIIGEWLYFHEWNDDPRELIIGCLYPIRKSDVSSLDLKHEEKTAFLKLINSKEFGQSWRTSYILSLAEKVTGWQIKLL